MAGSSTIMTGSSILTNLDVSTLSTFTQCCSETNIVSLSASEVVVATCKMMQRDDKQSELVVGNNIFTSLHFPDSELVLGTRTISFLHM